MLRTTPQHATNDAEQICSLTLAFHATQRRQCTWMTRAAMSRLNSSKASSVSATLEASGDATAAAMDSDMRSTPPPPDAAGAAARLLLIEARAAAAAAAAAAFGMAAGWAGLAAAEDGRAREAPPAPAVRTPLGVWRVGDWSGPVTAAVSSAMSSSTSSPSSSSDSPCPRRPAGLLPPSLPRPTL